MGCGFLDGINPSHIGPSSFPSAFDFSWHSSIIDFGKKEDARGCDALNLPAECSYFTRIPVGERKHRTLLPGRVPDGWVFAMQYKIKAGLQQRPRGWMLRWQRRGQDGAAKHYRRKRKGGLECRDDNGQQLRHVGTKGIQLKGMGGNHPNKAPSKTLAKILILATADAAKANRLVLCLSFREILSPPLHIGNRHLYSGQVRKTKLLYTHVIRSHTQPHPPPRVLQSAQAYLSMQTLIFSW